MAYVQTKDMSAMGSVFPGTVAAAMVLLSAILIAFQIGRQKAPKTANVPEDANESVPRRIAIIAAMGIWTATLPFIGFFTTSLVAFLVLMMIATFERLSARAVALHLVVAVVIVGAFQLLMDQALGLRMPMGIFY
jgi:hypothetical protein